MAEAVRPKKKSKNKSRSRTRDAAAPEPVPVEKELPAALSSLEVKTHPAEVEKPVIESDKEDMTERHQQKIVQPDASSSIVQADNNVTVATLNDDVSCVTNEAVPVTTSEVDYNADKTEESPEEELNEMQENDNVILSDESVIYTKQETDDTVIECANPEESLEQGSLQEGLKNNAVLLVESVALEETNQNATLEEEITPVDKTVVIEQTSVTQPEMQSRHNVAEVVVDTLEPFTDYQLAALYNNPELAHLDAFIDDFIKDAKDKEEFDFYELVLSYWKCRCALVKSQQGIQEIKAKWERDRDAVWETTDKLLTVTRPCRDGIYVTKEVPYKVMEFHQDKATVLFGHLKDISGLAYEELLLRQYNSQMARIRIESYLVLVHSSCEDLKIPNGEAFVSGFLPRQLSDGLVQFLCKLRDCISVLFMFKRRPLEEEGFIRDVDSWLQRLVAILLRVGSLPDQFFVLNHMLRCPPGSVAPMSSFLQFPSFKLSCSNIGFWENPLIHHFIVMVATITLRTRSRKEFLEKYKLPVSPGVKSAGQWTFVEEDREEDEDQEDCLYLLQESDLVALFDQLPIEDLFLYMLKISCENGDLKYCITKFTSNDIARILAFGSCLVTLLGRIFDTYNYLRYRQFLKRVSQTVRLVVQLISYHWSSYRRWRLESCGDSFYDTPVFLSISQQFSIARLQIEFDQFFFRGAHQIMSSKSAGAWQFLASMPYEAISSDAVVKVMSKFIRRNTAFTSDLSMESMLVDINTMVPGEAIFLLSALSNMAVARSAEDRAFIESVCQIEFEIAFVINSTKDFCCKDGRDNLASISSHHPFIVSYLLNHCQSRMDMMKEDVLALFKVLPLQKWLPTNADMNILRQWLIRMPIVSGEHKLARLILKSLNYWTTEENPSELFLSREFQCAIGLLLVDVYGCTFPHHAGGLALLENEAAGIIGQVSKLAVTSYNKIIHPNAQHEFTHWLWDVLLSLKLHDNDQPEDVESSQPEKLVQVDDLAQIKNGNGSSSPGWFGKTVTSMRQQNVSSLDVEHTHALLNVKRALQSLGSVASYVSLAMSNIGHSREKFLKNGLEKMAILLQNSCHDALLRLISLIVPLLVEEDGIAMATDGFFSLLDAVIHIDARQAGYAERVWQYPEPGVYTQQLAGIIVQHVAPHHETHEGSELLSRFWFSALSRVNMWRRDFSVQYLMDCLCKVVFSLQMSHKWFDRLFRDEFDLTVTSQLPRGLLASVMSWIANANLVTLLDPKADSQWSYFAYYALCNETAMELECGLWREITDEALLNPKLSFEAKYKRAVANVKATYIPPLEYLSIYRWADVALATHVDHPLLPLIWQKFFQLFLYRVPIDSSATGYKAGVGYQFFQAFHYSSKAKRMKAHLHATSAHHHEKSQQNEEDDGNLMDKTHLHDAVLHERLSGLYQTLALWLEESRLHDAHISLDTLPLVYWPDGLTRLFEGTQEPWMEYIDLDCIHNELSVLSSLWASSVRHERSQKNAFSQLGKRRDGTRTDEQRLLHKLARKSPRVPAPIAVLPSSPVPPVHTTMLLERATLIQTANHDLERFIIFAKKTSSLLANHVALDEEYAELLPSLYENALRNVMVYLECRQRKRSCGGAAEAIVTVTEPHLNDTSARMLHSNRDQWLQLVDSCMQPLSQDLCLGAMHVERIVTALVTAHVTCSAERSVQIRDTGIGLFYLLAQLIDDDVKRCHPAIQFFSSSVEVLGKEFIAVSGEEQMPLLESILSHNASVTCLAPFFSPNIYPERFPGLYSQVASTIDESSVSKFFVLLSKFDVHDWLMAGPPIQDRVAMVRFIFSALRKFGVTPSTDCCLVIDLMRYHFQLLLTYRFPEIYSESLRQLVLWSASSEVSVDCWDDVIYCIGGNPVEFTVRRGAGSVIEPCVLKPFECHDTLQWFAAYFDGLAKSPRAQSSEIFHLWKPYVRHLTRLLFFLFDNASSLLTQDNEGRSHEQACQKSWDCIAAIYSIWIAPSSSGTTWPLDFSNEAVALLQSFIEAIRFAAEKLQTSDGYCFVMSLCWLYFIHILSPIFSIPHVSEIYFSLLPSLPWGMFWPSLEELEVMAKLIEDSPLLCTFIATIIPLIPWQQLLSYYRHRGNHVVLAEYHASLFSLFLRLAAKKEAVTKNSSKLGALFESNDFFDWSYLKCDDIEESCQMFIKKVDPSFLLNLNAFGRQTLGLVKYVCAFKEPVMPENDGKRALYVRTVARLLERCIGRKGLNLGSISPVISALVKDVDAFAAIAPDRSHAEVNLMMTALLETSDVYQVDTTTSSHVFNCLRENLSSTSNQMLLLISISAVVATLSNVSQQIQMIEMLIEVYFESRAAPRSDEGNRTPVSWDKLARYMVLPNNKVDSLVKEAIKQHAILFLYARNVAHSTPQSISNDNIDVITDTVQWLGTMFPCCCCENKFVLLWYQALHAMCEKINVIGDKLLSQKIGKYVMHMGHSCQLHGEDRTYTGFLGVIGIGRKSMLPLS